MHVFDCFVLPNTQHSSTSSIDPKEEPGDDSQWSQSEDNKQQVWIAADATSNVKYSITQINYPEVRILILLLNIFVYSFAELRKS